MPRPSKRKRDEARYGKSTRLSDWILSGSFGQLGDCSPTPSQEADDTSGRNLTIGAVLSQAIDATSVHEYVRRLEVERHGEVLFDRMITGALPPFPICYVEARIMPGLSPQAKAWGWTIYSVPRGEEPQVVYDALVQCPIPGVYEKCKDIVLGVFSLGLALEPGSARIGVLCPAARSITFLDDRGNAMAPPHLALRQFESPEDTECIKNWAHSSMFDCLLAIRFMNAGNVEVTTHEPPVEINRERKKAGLAPFVSHQVLGTPKL